MQPPAGPGTSPDQLLEALDPEQREVAEALRGPVRVLAGAGTGKTRAITHRIAYGVATGVYNPTEVLAVTFTTRAAGEMRTRLGRSAPAVSRPAPSTRPRCGRLRYFWPKVYGGELPVLTESKLRCSAAARRRHRVETDQATLRDLASEVEWAKVSNVVPTTTPGSRQPAAARSPARPRDGGPGLRDYEDVKRDQGRMDMEDVLLCAAALLAEDERVAAQVRRQYKWFVVDEFQDVSPIQSALLDLWLGGRDDLCVVGDPAQTIYSFAGANADYLPTSRAGSPGPRRRAGAQLPLDAAGRRAPPTGCWPALPAPGFSCGPSRPPARGVVRRARRRGRRGGAGRGGRRGARRRRHVAARDRGAVPDQRAVRGVRGGAGGARRAVRRPRRRPVLRAARGQAGGHLLRGNAAAAGERGRATVESGRPTCGRCCPAWAGPAGAGRPRPDVRDRWESLQASSTQAEEFRAGTSEPTLSEFVAELDRRAAEQHAPVAEGVTLATLHAAKGLEWDVVFLAGLHDGTMPIVYAEGPAAVEEERRLLYVGMTRARQRLTVSWSLARTPGGRASRKPSRFLTGLRPESGPTGRPRPSRQPQAQGRRALPRVRQAVGYDGRAQGGSVRGLPGVVRRGAVRAAARVAGRAGRDRRRCRRTSCSPTSPCRRSRRSSRRTRGRCCGSTGSASPS
jgi:DNA helicase-2/ATP-dependent DNA helicase PcrA